MLEKALKAFFPGETGKLERELRNEGKNWLEWEKELVFRSLALSSIGAAIAFLLWEDAWIAGMLFLPLSALTLLLFFGLEGTRREREAREREEKVPELLLQAALMPGYVSPEEVLEQLGRPENGSLGRIFARLTGKIKKGAVPSPALRAEREKTPGKNAALFLELLELEFESGSMDRGLLKDMAENMLAELALQKELRAAVSLQRLSLIAGAGLLIPVSLGMLFRFIQGFDLGGMEELGVGMEERERTGLLAALEGAVPVYLAELAILVSVLLAFQEQRGKKALTYALGLVPGSLAFFLWASGKLVLPG